MAIYIFNLGVGYEPCGVDNAQGYRAKMLRHFSKAVKYIYTELPSKECILYYSKVGIDEEQMLSMHYFLADHLSLKASVKLEDRLRKFKENMPQLEIEDQGGQFCLHENGRMFASLVPNKKDSKYLDKIYYFKEKKLIRTEIYADGIVYAESFMTAKSGEKVYAKLVRRTFYKSDGAVAYEQVFKDGRELYLLPDGKNYTKQQFIMEFVRKLNLSEADTVILDRCAQFDFLQPLFQFGNQARFVAVLHSEHYFEEGRDSNWFYQNLNWEYLYWFKYSRIIDTMVVSTQEQKEKLAEDLRKYHCFIPNIEVIPAGGIEYLKYPEKVRRPNSLIAVSRLQMRKRPYWIIKSVIKAHKRNSNITLDYYGKGPLEAELQTMIEENQAQSYIKLMGYREVTDLYREYEVFITASIWETLGLSTMEAIGSGTAAIGLDVPYGNRQFVQSDGNGYLVAYDGMNVNEEKLTDMLANKIVQIFEDEQRLERFHQRSYEIAGVFLTQQIEDLWKKMLI